MGLSFQNPAWGGIPGLLSLLQPEAGGGPAVLDAKDDPLGHNPHKSAARLGLLELSGLRSGLFGFEKRAPCPRPLLIFEQLNYYADSMFSQF
jgi:hypothetical protein